MAKNAIEQKPRSDDENAQTPRYENEKESARSEEMKKSARALKTPEILTKKMRDDSKKIRDKTPKKDFEKDKRIIKKRNVKEHEEEKELETKSYE